MSAYMVGRTRQASCSLRSRIWSNASKNINIKNYFKCTLYNDLNLTGLI